MLLLFSKSILLFFCLTFAGVSSLSSIPSAFTTGLRHLSLMALGILLLMLFGAYLVRCYHSDGRYWGEI